MRILLVEDEPKISAFIQQGLTENGFSVVAAYDGKTGLSMALQGNYSVIILDVMLPHLNGLEVCQALRAQGVETPVLMLTALGTIDDKVEGLGKGADDYLVKPFHFKELLARIGALTRRAHSSPGENNLEFADVVLDRQKKSAVRAGKEISLTAKEYKLLELFLTNAGRVLSRSQIAERVWGYDFDPDSNVIDVYINYLRNKIDKGFDKKLLHTMVGMGYVLKEA
jgi:heavy metal response regulator